jgi:hypothetical protein
MPNMYYLNLARVVLKRVWGRPILEGREGVRVLLELQPNVSSLTKARNSCC